MVWDSSISEMTKQARTLKYKQGLFSLEKRELEDYMIKV